MGGAGQAEQRMHEHGEDDVRPRAQPSAYDVDGHAEASNHTARDAGLPSTSTIQRLQRVPADAAMPW
eukprot:922961-Pleurochrysis_carterae.AAC.2